VVLRRARPDDIDAIAALFRLSRNTALPDLPDLHTPDDDRAFFHDHVFATCAVWVAEDANVLTGFCAFRNGWIDHLYVHPAHQRQGVGSALLRPAMEANETLHLWTFQRNAGARAFYEAHGFSCVRTTNGEANEEHEPDALYAWSRSSSRRISFVSSKPSRS
jgi:putative acetyltransferase